MPGNQKCSQAGGGQGGRSWSKQTLFCAAAHGELSAFSRPRDALEASPPAARRPRGISTGLLVEAFGLCDVPRRLRELPAPTP
eukprot:s3494_g9.t2